MSDLDKTKKIIQNADAIVITAGNEIPEIISEDELNSVGTLLGKKYSSWSAAWLSWSKAIDKFFLHRRKSKVLQDLRYLLKEKDYFIATTNFGHFFEDAGFNARRVFNLNGDWTKMQCSSGINHGVKDARPIIQKIIQAITAGQEMNEALVPKCEECDAPMVLSTIFNSHFFPDSTANTVLRWFLTGNEDKKLVFLELGIDETSQQLLIPMIKLVEQFPSWFYLAADLKKENVPETIKDRSLILASSPSSLLAQLVDKG